MIKAKNLTKWYPTAKGAKYVFRNVSFTIPTDANVGLIGKNGAGKSTLLRMIGGMDFPNSGHISTSFNTSPPFGTASGLSAGMTGKDNAKFVCRIHGDDRKTMTRRVRYIAEFAEIGEYFDLPVAAYSSGMRSRLAFAISMAFDYDYYLIDELMSVGDMKFNERAKEAFEDKRGQSGAIMVSHNLRILMRDCDVGLYIKDCNAFYYEDIRDAVRAYKKDQE